MDIDLLIIGQGISGTFLYKEARLSGLSVCVIDDGFPASASRVAAGLINPVTGKRVVTTWMADQLLPLAREAYGDAYLKETPIVTFFSNREARTLFLERLSQDPTYLEAPEDTGARVPYFHDYYGNAVIRPAYVADIAGLITVTRFDLRERGLIREQAFADDQMTVLSDGVRFDDIHATHAIFCDGIASSARPWFERLPFSPSKGEALIVEIPDLPPDAVFHKALNMVPLGDGLYWVGASYEWDFKDALPSPAFRARTEEALRQWLKVSFRTVDHRAAIRPTTVEQKPFVGLHPLHHAIGILGGMGTKGCSLAPFFARQLVQHIVHGTPILPAADVRRFSRTLGG
jgi:glycine/D-amino acid oxidase-like deaminating enzyme